MVRTKAIAKRRDRARREEASSSNSRTSNPRSGSESEKETTRDAEVLETEPMHDAEASETQPMEDVEATETQPMQPDKFFFNTSEYNNVCKIQTRCDLHIFLELMGQDEFKEEMKWFKRHPQFKHIFHMHQEENHRLQGLYMLLLRTVNVDRRTCVWFMVNGIPIRYSLREHGLISGFYCHEYSTKLYPKMNLKKYTNDFMKRQFSDSTASVTVKQVKEKLISMEQSSPDRLNVAILYFLGAVLTKKAGAGAYISKFLSRMADDPELCEAFSWGRMTFQDSISYVYHVMDGAKNGAKDQLTFPGFIFPLELLAFECIPSLKRSFRDDIGGTLSRGCPRMCRQKFKLCSMKG